MSNVFKTLGFWGWKNVYTPPEILRKRGNVVANIFKLKLITPGIDWNAIRENPVVLITGDGGCLAQDVKTFESWGIPHDLFCVNRSLVFFERQVDHWAAIDAEESLWFSENATGKVMPRKDILRHTIGDLGGFDIGWERDQIFENDIQSRVFIGNTGYFAVLASLHMGYKKIVLAGMPLDMNPHWYEPESEHGPMWSALAFIQWIDFKRQHPESFKVKSLNGYSSFILGEATKEWLNGG